MQPIYILYGTETYNSQDLAERTGEALSAQGLPVAVLGMDEIDPVSLAGLHTALIITSTFGAGEPPSNAADLYDHLMAESGPLPALHFSVCGLGDTSYPDFCQCAKDLDARLEALGARRIAPRQDCDRAYEAPWQAWLSRVSDALAGLDLAAADAAAQGGGGHPAASAAPAPTAGGPAGALRSAIHVLYGTETYHSQDLAERTGEAIAAAGREVVVLDMADFEPEDLGRLHTLLVITSTYGAGEPPANAEHVHSYLMGEAAALPGLHFSVCGLGDTAYPDFCQCGKDFDAQLEALGGRRIAARQDCDTDYEAPFEAWLAQVLRALPPAPAAGLGIAQAPAAQAPAAQAPARASAKAPPALGTRKNPFFATVIDNHNLNAPGGAKETRHLALSLVGSGMEYVVGDALGLFPRNDPELVYRVLWATGLQGTEAVQVGDEWLYLRDALIYRLDITWADAKLIKLAAESGGAGAASFVGLAQDAEARKTYLAGHHVIDILAGAAMRPEAQTLVKALRPLAPRLYSISSSPKAHPGEVHLTVDVVRYNLHGLDRKGISSCFIAERLVPGAQVPIYIQRAADFHLTADDLAPIIMVGPGTGIAPFRAFLEEREARGAEGYSWLFFGARKEAQDFLYRDQVLAWHAKGVLTRLDLAFSRDQARKIYVQDRMWEHGPDLWAWIDAGSHIYICGDASRMAKDVHAMLKQIISMYGGHSADEAEAYLEGLRKQGRYLRDVY